MLLLNKNNGDAWQMSISKCVRYYLLTTKLFINEKDLIAEQKSIA